MESSLAIRCISYPYTSIYNVIECSIWHLFVFCAWQNRARHIRDSTLSSQSEVIPWKYYGVIRACNGSQASKHIRIDHRNSVCSIPQLYMHFGFSTESQWMKISIILKVDMISVHFLLICRRIAMPTREEKCTHEIRVANRMISKCGALMWFQSHRIETYEERETLRIHHVFGLLNVWESSARATNRRPRSFNFMCNRAINGTLAQRTTECEQKQLHAEKEKSHHKTWMHASWHCIRNSGYRKLSCAHKPTNTQTHTHIYNVLFPMLLTLEWSGVIASTNCVNAENGTNIVPRTAKRNYYYACQCRWRCRRLVCWCTEHNAPTLCVCVCCCICGRASRCATAILVAVC